MIDLDELRHPLCFLRGFWWTIRYGASISGHDFQEVPSADPKAQVLECKTCGYESKGYYP